MQKEKHHPSFADFIMLNVLFSLVMEGSTFSTAILVPKLI